MKEVLDFFSKLLDTSDWPPRWHCGKWTEFHGWLYIISDLLIWSAYFAIPLIILKFISRKSKARFVRAYFLFAAFILACGSTHLLDAITFWFPAYRLNALVRFITGVVSWATVFYMIKIMPEALTLKSNEELEREVTERQRAEAELRLTNQQFQVAQDIANLGHWHWDVATDRLVWSDKLYQIFGLKAGTPLSYQHFLDRLPEEEQDRVAELVNQALQEKHFPTFNHRLRMEDGSEKVISTKAEVLLDINGAATGIIGTSQDVTELHKAQHSLLEKTYALEATNQELQRFAFVASHDLQEPLRKILTFSSMLQQGATQSSPKESAYLDKIVQSATRMQNLIEDILHFSRVRSQERRFEPTNLQEVLEQVLSDMEVIIERTGAEITWEELPVIDAVPSQMGQLFQNLLANAIKFTKQGVHPKIHIGAQHLKGNELKDHASFALFSGALENGRNFQPQASYCLLHVSDQGIGFDPAFSGKVFEIFQRLHTSSEYTGTGIGLAICKRIAENHHGAIAVTSMVGKGTSFYILLPLVQA